MNNTFRINFQFPILEFVWTSYQNSEEWLRLEAFNTPSYGFSRQIYIFEIVKSVWNVLYLKRFVISFLRCDYKKYVWSYYRELPCPNTHLIQILFLSLSYHRHKQVKSAQHKTSWTFRPNYILFKVYRQYRAPNIESGMRPKNMFVPLVRAHRLWFLIFICITLLLSDILLNRVFNLACMKNLLQCQIYYSHSMRWNNTKLKYLLHLLLLDENCKKIV